MIIHPESHLQRVGAWMQDKRVLEIGCGDGSRSIQLAQFCSHLVGVDPNEDALREARALHANPNIEYVLASAVDLPFPDATFEAAAFVLSLHHIEETTMPAAIDEALRVATPDAPIMFIEPGFRGSFFELDAELEACDGDERLQKARA